MEGKYGLIIRAPKSNQKKQPTRLPVPKPSIFNNDDEDDDVEADISRQAVKNKSLEEVEEQHKKALEEDPTVFDYDGVYEDMKSKIVQPKAQDRQKREVKYIQGLMEHKKQRDQEHEIIYEKKLAKERSKEEDQFADKEKFITGAYKKKLAEQKKWMEEQRIRELREQKEDVTKKSDISDFYFNLQKNVAYGADGKSVLKPSEGRGKEPAATREDSENPRRQEGEPIAAKERGKEPAATREGSENPRRQEGEPIAGKGHFKIPERPILGPQRRDQPSSSSPGPSSSGSEDEHERKRKPAPVPERRSAEPDAAAAAPHPHVSGIVNPPPAEEKQPDNQPPRDHHKKSEDAIAAARERYLARKRAKVE